MFRWILYVAVSVCLASFGIAAQDTSSTSPGASSSNPQKPEGTEIVRHGQDTVVRPMTKPVKINSGTIKSAQTELQRRGYSPGQADGVEGPQTRAAIAKFQSDQGIAQTGQLDSNTLSKLNVGGTNIVSSAPADLGRGGKAAGHNIKEGHPVDAGKAMAQGSESFGKKVGKGTKSLAVRGAQKVGRGISSIGNKVENKTEGNDNSNSQNQQNPEQ